MYFAVGDRAKSIKKIKYTLNNRAVSLKHVTTCNIKDVISLVTCVRRHGLNNP